MLVFCVLGPAFAGPVRADGTDDPVGAFGRPLSAAAIARAVATVARTAPAQPAPGWGRVLALDAGASVRVTSDGAAPSDGEVVSVDGLGITIRRPSGAVERLERGAVREIRDGVRRGSVPYAIVGASAGAFLGAVTALHLALRDCGGDCADEKILLGTALVGAPVGGGLAGYHLFKRRGQVIYRRPAPSSV